jgi:transcriptional regulator NrdR family protein
VIEVAEKQQRKNVHGLECPLCGCPESEVIWTRKRMLTINGKLTGSIVRARECDACRYRFQTSESVTEASKPPDELH